MCEEQTSAPRQQRVILTMARLQTVLSTTALLLALFSTFIGLTESSPASLVSRGSPATALDAGLSISEQFQPCSSGSLVLYRAELTTKWTRESFPKHYPEWRPPAQWTKFIGRSHDDSFTLFRIGEQASEGMKNFAESGRSENLDEHAQGKDGILDSFAGPAISQGAGKSNAEFFADANHTLVSLASRIVPSPDWIIGIDSLNLCVEGRWADILSVELDPIDVGTDKGFTFTSPNWPQEPPQPISVLTPNSPDHPASSFYYPGLAELPKMASLRVVKVQEYKLMTAGRDGSPNSARHLPSSSPAASNNLEVVSVSVKDNDVTYETVKSFSVHLPQHHPQTSTTTPPADSSSSSNKPNPTLAAKDDPDVVSKSGLLDTNGVDDDYDTNNGNAGDSNYVDDSMGSNDVSSLNSVDYIGGSNVEGKSAMDLLELYAKKKKFNTKRKLRRHRPRHCVVSEWSPWRPCSKTCGIGETVRTRTVMRHAKRGGRPCPTLEERKWCGSQRDCNYKYFNWGSKKLV